MPATYYIIDQIMDELFGATDYTPLATVYFGLSTTTFTQATTTPSGEPSTGSYARVSFTNDKTNWDDASSGVLDNDVVVTFPTSSGSWGTIQTVFIADANTAGNVLFYKTLSPTLAVGTGTTVEFAVGAIIATMT